MGKAVLFKESPVLLTKSCLYLGWSCFDMISIFAVFELIHLFLIIFFICMSTLDFDILYFALHFQNTSKVYLHDFQVFFVHVKAG